MIPYPEEKFRRHVASVSPRYPALDISVYGNRDRRGSDNDILIWLTEDDELHILVPRASRCYAFKEMIDHGHSVEIIQV